MMNGSEAAGSRVAGSKVEKTRIVVVSDDLEGVSLEVPAGTGDAKYWSKRILDLVGGVRLVKRGDSSEMLPLGLRTIHAGIAVNSQ